MQDIFIRWPDLHETVSLSRSTVWRLERRGAFPRRRQLSANSVGWLKSEVVAWIASRNEAATMNETAISARSALRSTRTNTTVIRQLEGA